MHGAASSVAGQRDWRRFDAAAAASLEEARSSGQQLAAFTVGTFA